MRASTPGPCTYRGCRASRLSKMRPCPVASAKGNLGGRVAGVKIGYLGSTASGGLQGMLRILASMPTRAAGTSGGNGTIGAAR